MESIDELVKALGPAFIDTHLVPLKEAVMKLLEADIDDIDSEDEVEGEGEAE